MVLPAAAPVTLPKLELVMFVFGITPADEIKRVLHVGAQDGANSAR